MTTIRIAPSHADMARRMLTTPRRGKLDWLWQWDATRTGWAWLSPWGGPARSQKLGLAPVLPRLS